MKELIDLLSVQLRVGNQQFNRGQIVLKKLEIARWKKLLADATMLFDVETDFLDDDMFVFDTKNDVEDLLLDNIVSEEDAGDEGKTAYEEDEEQDTSFYEDYNDEETTDLQDYDED